MKLEFLSLQSKAASASFETEMSPDKVSSATAGFTAGVDFFFDFLDDFEGLKSYSDRSMSTSSVSICSSSFGLPARAFLGGYGERIPLLGESEISIG